MVRGLSYTDAVKVLGGAGPGTEVVSNLLGGALTAATAGGADVALSLFDAKGEVVRLGQVVTTRLHERVRGLARHDRSSRLHAAHGILVVTAFFEAFDEVVSLTEVEPPELTRTEQLLLAAGTPVEGSWVPMLFRTRLPAPSPELSYAELLQEVRVLYGTVATRMMRHLEGLAAWEKSTYSGRERAGLLVEQRLPELALARYEELHRRLAVDIPEFAVWVGRAEAQHLGNSLAGLRELLERATSGQSPSQRRAALAAAYRAELERPIAGAQDGGDLIVPTLGEAYVDARFQVKAARSGQRIADHAWWDAPVRGDLAAFLAAYLTTPQAAEAPLVLLGQPGAGKSVLTRVLAARLPAADYLVVRVSLRDVPAEADIQQQIELSVRAAIGEDVAWAELSRDAGGAMPLILLDGFDELLQATGIHQSDYLQRVADFQRREAVQGRPAAVLVTTRVAVADRARLPDGSLAARLEGFDDDQVARWLRTWNGVNAARPDHRDLTPELAFRFPVFCEQPLLLLMLALYDGTTHALQEHASLGTAQLYERLLGSFAEREVRRRHPGHPDLAEPVEEEFVRLSVVAFAMFNRLRQSITEAELDADLSALGLAARRPDGLPHQLTAAEELIGRFFFIQRSQALLDSRPVRTYEFLHATFGEYLVARLTVRVLRDTAVRAAAATLPLSGGPRDDGLLQTLLCYMPLAARATVLSFLRDLLRDEDRTVLRAWLLEALRSALIRPTSPVRPYNPADKRVDHMMATYALNLALLTLACDQPLRASELFLHAADPAAWLRGAAQQWAAAVPSGIWNDLVDRLTVTRTWDADDRRDLVVDLTEQRRPPRVDLTWTLADPGAAVGSYERLANRLTLTGGPGDDVLRHAVEPLGLWIGDAVTTVAGDPQGTIAHALLRLFADDNGLDAYQDAARRIIDSTLPRLVTDRVVAMFLTLLTRDASRLPVGPVLRWLTWAARTYPTDRVLPLVLTCLEAAAAPAPDIAKVIDELPPAGAELTEATKARLWACLTRLGYHGTAVPPDLTDPSVVALLTSDRSLAAFYDS